MGDVSIVAAFAIGAPEILLIIAALLIIIGIALAFRGRKLWAGLMSIIGAVIGGTLGYLFGMLINDWITALILSMVGAFIGSLLFGYIVKIALAFVTSLLVAGLAYIAIGQSMSQDMRIVVAAVLLLVIYAVAYWFIQEIIAFVTALLGGLLVGVGIILLGLGTTAAVSVGGLVFLAGFVIQSVDYGREKRRRVARAAAATYYVASEPVVTESYEQAPPPPPEEEPGQY
jgi:hypothetical protein